MVQMLKSITKGSSLVRFKSMALKLDPSLMNDCSDIPRDKRDFAYPKLGNRDIVGYGHSGMGEYFDHIMSPMPGIRFRPNSNEFYALRKLEQGDWKILTLDQKKQLYRNNFRYTYEEFQNCYSYRWSLVVGISLILSSLGLIKFVYLSNTVQKKLPDTLNPEYKEKMVEHWIRQMQGLTSGISQHWDYEKNEWKKK